MIQSDRHSSQRLVEKINNVNGEKKNVKNKTTDVEFATHRHHITYFHFRRKCQSSSCIISHKLSALTGYQAGIYERRFQNTQRRREWRDKYIEECGNLTSFSFGETAPHKIHLSPFAPFIAAQKENSRSQNIGRRANFPQPQQPWWWPNYIEGEWRTKLNELYAPRRTRSRAPARLRRRDKCVIISFAPRTRALLHRTGLPSTSTIFGRPPFSDQRPRRRPNTRVHVRTHI